MRSKKSTGRRPRRKRLLKSARGYYGSKSKRYKNAKEQLIKSLAYATRDRKRRKRDFRALWITRLSAAAKLSGLSYSKLIHGLKAANVTLDRKSLSEIAVRDPEAFKELTRLAKAALPAA